MRGHILELEMLTLDPKSFENIQDFFTKFKDLLSQLKACGVDKSKEEKQIVLTILSKIGPEFSVFVSTFHTVRFASRATWKMPSLEDFIESLTQEKTKLINMGTIKGPRAHALTVHDGSHKYKKSKDKDKWKSHSHPNKEGYTKPFTDASGSKGEKRRNAHTVTKGSIWNLHAYKKNISNVSNTSTKQPWRSHPPRVQIRRTQKI
jgi:hypothetical protein